MYWGGLKKGGRGNSASFNENKISSYALQKSQILTEIQKD